ncbi:hypothetical protein FRC12_005544 [Ceratobasidium sp. 428]|nr:hypothetical protein FRC12_005544 [Ceratobasidium sp. 428]
MNSKSSKRNRPDNFLDRPANEVVRSRPATPEHADTAGLATAHLDPIPQVPAAELRSTGLSWPPDTGINTSVPMVSVTPAAESTHRFLTLNPTGVSTGELPHIEQPSELEFDVDSLTNLLPPVPTQQQAAPPGSTRAHGRATTTLKNGLRRLGKATIVVPQLKSAVDMLATCVDVMSIAGKGHRDFELLAEDLVASVKTLEKHLSQSSAVEITESVLDALSQLNELVGDIGAKQSQAAKRKHAGAEQDIEDVLACYRRVDSLFQRITSDFALSGMKMVQDTRQVASRNLNMTSEVLEVAKGKVLNNSLDKMQPVKQARYDAGAADVRRNGCTADTRTSVLRNLVDWSNVEDGAKVYWMNGMAGTGKTTIAYSFCETLKNTNQLGASFFCSRLLPECRDTTRIVPTLAYQLARTLLGFQVEILKIMNDDPDVCTSGVKHQFNALIATPLQKLNRLSRIPRLVLVVDALDECSDRTTAQQVLDALFSYASDLPVKFFVTCRPEPGLFDKVMAETLQTRSIFHLHDIEQSLVQADIQTYLQSELGTVQLTDHQIELVAERAGKLFIYAATVVRYLRPTGVRVDAKKRLDVILKTGQSSSSKAYESLDALYRTIVAEALENPELEPWDAENIKSLLHTVLCARVPLSVESLASLLGFRSASEAEAGIECLRSVIHVSEGQKLVSTLHASFPDFMLDAGRSRELWCDERSHHHTLARRCFVTMENGLVFNICHLESSFVLDKNVLDLASRIHRISPHLLYACIYWSEHMTSGSNDTGIGLNLTIFMTRHVLFWMEVMNLKGLISRSTIMLSGAIRWMESARMSDDECALCIDVLKFATVVASNPVCNSTAHIYISVLALWNRDSPMWMHYGARLSKPVRIEGSAMRHRQSASLGQWKIGHWIASAVASPDGRCVASLGRGRAMHVWDAYTGALLAGPFVGSAGEINLITVSRDGARVASGLSDNTIHVWDIHTGQPMHAPLGGYDGRVTSLVFSLNGNQIASGYTTGAIYIWDIETGQELAGSFKGHRYGVRCLSYSPDGNRLVSGSNDRTICVWDVQAGRLILGPLTGHNGHLCEVTFSGDGGRIISMSDDSTAVHVWDARTGLIVNTIKGHTEKITALTCSPDGHNILLGSDNKTISIWDIETGQATGNPYAGHQDRIIFVAYSPDGHRLISGSKDGTVYIWDPQVGHIRTDAPARHAVSPVYSVCFSSDGKRIAGGYWDGTVRVWDAYSGDMLVGPFKVHSGAVDSIAFAPDGSKIVSGSTVWSEAISILNVNTGGIVVGQIEGDNRFNHPVAFSPDGRHIASPSSNRTIRIWDAETGYLTSCLFGGHTESIDSVAYSPDGHRLVSGSGDRTIRVWDVRTGQTVVGPLRGHTKGMPSVTFSPDGRQILSASYDRTIRLWDAQTGLRVSEPFRGHTNHVRSAAYSPDGRFIVSGSDDCTVRVWDAETGLTVAGPFQEHTTMVKSVAYSPDGSCFASADSKDGSIRIWRLPVHNIHQSDPLNNWTMNEDGWIVTSDSSLLFWVPQDLRSDLLRLQNTVVLHPGVWLGLDFKDAAIGLKWTECFRH